MARSLRFMVRKHSHERMSYPVTTTTAAHPSSAATAMPWTGYEDDLYAEGNSFAGPENDTDTEIKALFGKDGFTFKDFLDIINPLQHLPVVGTIYRALTGDKLEPGPRIIGGTLFGGIGGFVSSLVNAVVEDETGSDIGDKALALLTGNSAEGTAVAENDAPTVAKTTAATETTTAPPATTATTTMYKAKPDALATAPPQTLPIHAGPPTKQDELAARVADAKTAQSGTEDPTEALIRARAAVPALRQPIFRGVPPAAAHAAVRQASRPTTSLALANTAPHAASGPETAASGVAGASATEAPGASPLAPSPDVATMMRDALDKYEALMKKRTAPSISAEF